MSCHIHIPLFQPVFVGPIIFQHNENMKLKEQINRRTYVMLELSCSVAAMAITISITMIVLYLSTYVS